MLKAKIPEIAGYTKEELLWICENTYGSSILKEYSDIEDWDVLVGVIPKKDRAKWDKRKPQHYSENEKIIELVDHILILMTAKDNESALEIQQLELQKTRLTEKIDDYFKNEKALQERGDKGDRIDGFVAMREAQRELDFISDKQIKTMEELLALRNKIIVRNQFIIDLRVAAIEPATITPQ